MSDFDLPEALDWGHPALGVYARFGLFHRDVTAGEAELRRWGHRMALSALVWRMGKYERQDDGLRDLAASARRHVGLVQSAWLSDRRARAGEGAGT
ncbi:hypothetical protein ACN2XU_02660 [Primorskyibacter sp. 2E107]|uniref:hypothetical protein n=1 Tax=Primorskyibacter sp. 2E107 TaxID=3403458 RepID=UPI003AF786D7